MVTVEGNGARFRFFRPQAQCVYLVGDFNGWRTQELKMKPRDGWWEANLTLPGGNYRFRYLADGQWFTDFAAFGIEYGPFGTISVLRIPGPGEQANRQMRLAPPIDRGLAIAESPDE